MAFGSETGAPARRIEARLAERGGLIEFLRLPALAFAAVVRARNELYDRGWLPRAQLDAPVVSVGNLTTGGTGKTPCVAWLARELARLGHRPGLLARGYKAARGELNDEGRWLSDALPDVPQVQAADRVRGGCELLRRGVDVILLDDGFQHRRLARALDLVLIDSTQPWGLAPPACAGPDGEGVRALLPRGLMREPLSGLARADAVILTRCDQASEGALEHLSAACEKAAPGVPVLRAAHAPVAWIDAAGVRRPPQELRGRALGLISGIGNPAAFERSVAALGADVREVRRFPDHHGFVRADVDDWMRAEREVLCTAKDAVKLRAAGVPVGQLDVEWVFLQGAQVLRALLEALPPSRARRERAAMHEGLHG